MLILCWNCYELKQSLIVRPSKRNTRLKCKNWISFCAWFYCSRSPSVSFVVSAHSPRMHGKTRLNDNPNGGILFAYQLLCSREYTCTALDLERKPLEGIFFAHSFIFAPFLLLLVLLLKLQKRLLPFTFFPRIFSIHYLKAQFKATECIWRSPMQRVQCIVMYVFLLKAASSDAFVKDAEQNADKVRATTRLSCAFAAETNKKGAEHSTEESIFSNGLWNRTKLPTIKVSPLLLACSINLNPALNVRLPILPVALSSRFGPNNFYGQVFLLRFRYQTPRICSWAYKKKLKSAQ